MCIIVGMLWSLLGISLIQEEPFTSPTNTLGIHDEIYIL